MRSWIQWAAAMVTVGIITPVVLAEGTAPDNPKPTKAKIVERASKDSKEKEAKERAQEEARKKALANQEEMQKKRAKAQQEAQAKREEAARKRELAAKQAREKAQAEKTSNEDKSKNAEERIDKRQENQAKRIEHGVKKGYLTADELAQLENQQARIADLEAQFKADGTLTRDEFKALRNELDAASRCIWAQKHDEEGNQMPVYRLGKNVFAKAELTSQLQNQTLSPEQVKLITREFREMLALKHKLASQDLSEEQRTIAQNRYNELLSRYFEVRTAAAEG